MAATLYHAIKKLQSPAIVEEFPKSGTGDEDHTHVTTNGTTPASAPDVLLEEGYSNIQIAGEGNASNVEANGDSVTLSTYKKRDPDDVINDTLNQKNNANTFKSSGQKSESKTGIHLLFGYLS